MTSNQNTSPYVKMLESITKAQGQFVGEEDPRKLFDSLLDTLLELTQSEYGFIGEILHEDSGQPYLKTHAITDISWNEETKKFYEEGAPDGLEFKNLKTLFGAVITSGEPVIANMPAKDPRAGGIPSGHPDLNAFLGLPFYTGEKFVGMVGVANRPSGYDDELVEFLQPFLSTCSQIIEGYRDRNARRKAEGDLHLAIDEAEKANKAKSQFLANMSHELRTPLNAIIGYTEMLFEDFEANPSKDDLNKILVSSKHLLSLVDDILDLSKVESGDFEIHKSDFNLKDLISELEALILPMASKNQNKLTIQVDDKLTQMNSDKRKLFQILINLSSNACKFTKNGEIQVSLLHTNIDGIEKIKIRVSDNGIGIPKKNIGDIFKPFVQVDPSTTRQHEGTGLGLAICNKFCELLGGSISCESEEGKGSSFEVLLPLKLGQEG